MPLAETLSDALRNAGAFGADLVRPGMHATLRLGVTGLSRAGKTVFITALVRNLMAGGRLPFLEAHASRRIRTVHLEPQPDDTVPRFDFEAHVAALEASPPVWPESTRQISQLRIAITYDRLSPWRRWLGPGRLNIDIVDYPGEWLLDLPLLDRRFDVWSAEALAHAQANKRARHAEEWVALAHRLAADPPADAPSAEKAALKGAALFKTYLAAIRAEGDAPATHAPGRFLMPGELDGSPALTFMPLPPPPAGCGARPDPLRAMLARRFEAYKAHVVKPFFRDHFARLDRQIVLVDALAALDRGPEALGDLEAALTAVLACFRQGANSWLSRIVAPRVDRILFAATKADHLHHTSHDRLEAVLAHLVRKAAGRAEGAGARIGTVALAAIRATREGEAMADGVRYPCIVGTPMPGERIGAERFDGRREAAIFPGEIPEDVDNALAHGRAAHPGAPEMEVVRFRPPVLPSAPERASPMPHIRLDRALQFLIGDRLT